MLDVKKHVLPNYQLPHVTKYINASAHNTYMLLYILINLWLWLYNCNICLNLYNGRYVLNIRLTFARILTIHSK